MSSPPENIGTTAEALDLRSLCQQIQALLHQSWPGWDAIGALPGFSIHLRANEFPGDCVTFAFGVDRAVEDEGIMSQYVSVERPEPGDIVCYFGSGGLHYGVFLGENRVRSKFGLAHIYEHPMDVVPPMYGAVYQFLRKVHDTPQLEDPEELRRLDAAIERALKGVIY